jgi:peroxin-1
VQILKAVSRKLRLGPDVQLERLASITDGYTGADLQALLYNAQLEVIHSLIDNDSPDSSGATSSSGSGKLPASDTDDAPPAKIVQLGEEKMSGAERAALLKYASDIQEAIQKQKTGGVSVQEDAAPKLPPLSWEHLDHALQDMRPSISPSERQHYEQVYASFSAGRNGLSNNSQEIRQRATMA